MKFNIQRRSCTFPPQGKPFPLGAQFCRNSNDATRRNLNSACGPFRSYHRFAARGHDRKKKLKKISDLRVSILSTSEVSFALCSINRCRSLKMDKDSWLGFPTWRSPHKNIRLPCDVPSDAFLPELIFLPEIQVCIEKASLRTCSCHKN